MENRKINDIELSYRVNDSSFDIAVEDLLADLKEHFPEFKRESRVLTMNNYENKVRLFYFKNRLDVKCKYGTEIDEQNNFLKEVTDIIKKYFMNEETKMVLGFSVTYQDTRGKLSGKIDFPSETKLFKKVLIDTFGFQVDVNDEIYDVWFHEDNDPENIGTIVQVSQHKNIKDNSDCNIDFDFITGSLIPEIEEFYKLTFQ